MGSVTQNIEANFYTPKTLAKNIYKMVITIIMLFITGPHNSLLCLQPVDRNQNS
jgi:hypothetical protein